MGAYLIVYTPLLVATCTCYSSIFLYSKRNVAISLEKAPCTLGSLGVSYAQYEDLLPQCNDLPANPKTNISVLVDLMRQRRTF
ncbi:hypothetical protein METBIDRAFT_30433 [Metschnikowia bicuspidata var. bicuspidata NRRL YB-4993]|uniref:Uncharacterized protein n=1 Tax=Metschnikowia bicuspidata var. bicuspidata NRRL YB-4993 TaxID=869754 RepID=A0A1A0HJL8_9ASCO|nr:hypothetical protein METBIDRAFT_30433 [Metschnikowia bicuspidata var. bicuspidata NRRL YB-4993]OBA24082.1 hypothetical protein METBIDRAFT_30433 [Metschnikowia bicuspidata var. bicuspidata NRRL YB-4993]